MPTVVSAPRLAPRRAERDGAVDRPAAGIQHDGCAAELASARELFEILRAIRGHDADRADPAPAVRLARDPAKPHRHFAFFEGDASEGPTTISGCHGRQCDAKHGGAK